MQEFYLIAGVIQRFASVWYEVFVESFAPRGSQQKLRFYLSAKHCK
jgi:hypothetical protein